MGNARMRDYGIGRLAAVTATAAVIAGLSVAVPDAAAREQKAKAGTAQPPAAAASAAPPIPQAPSATAGPGIDTLAPHVFLYEADTNTVLFEKNADEHMPTASMSKMMTAYMVFEYLKEGRAKLDDELPVSEHAWRTQGSKMFVPIGSKISIENLIRGMVIESGNDACIVLAEGLAGSEGAFVDQMNEKAKQIGLKDSHFVNVDGMPDPEHYSTARDLATLAMRTIQDFPEYYKYYSEKNFNFNNINQGNRNPLLYKDLGADGLKTGHTEEAGYSLTASVLRDKRRIILVLGGDPTMKARASESERLIEWAFREFQNYKLFTAGDKVDDADVWLGAEPKVALTVDKDLVVTLPRRARKDMKVAVSYDKPIPAPVKKGQPVGEVVVTAPDTPPAKAKLFAAADDGKMGVVGRMATVAGYWIWGDRR
jgi:D-alanyl-D-alanine carboxypeptidase (penicillin-binding protein 5/6)